MDSNLMSGFRALDLTNEQGFLCGKILSDLGVDVIKVEKPGGDASRMIPPFYHNVPDPNKSLYWFSYNTNKRGITLNLEINAGQELFRKLVEKADFVLESFAPGYMDKLGLGYEALSQINPKIIMTSITPFGQSGPYSSFKGSDLTLQALGIMLSEIGDPDRPPVRMSVPQAYVNAGADAAEGTMVAHYYRGITGEGQHIDVSIMESVIRSCHYSLPLWEGTRVVQKRKGKWSTVSVGLNNPIIWECQNGYVNYTIYAGLVGARSNQGLTEWMDSEKMAPSFIKEKDWINWDWNKTTQAELDSIIGAFSLFFRSHTKEELQNGAIERGIMLYEVCNIADIVNNVQLKARDFWVSIEHNELGDSITYPGAFAKSSLNAIGPFRRGPLVGEHNGEVYGEELHLSKSKLDALKAKGVI